MKFIGFAKSPIYTHERWCEGGLHCNCAVVEPLACRICLANDGTPKANGACLTCRTEMGWHIDVA